MIKKIICSFSRRSCKVRKSIRDYCKKNPMFRSNLSKDEIGLLYDTYQSGNTHCMKIKMASMYGEMLNKEGL